MNQSVHDLLMTYRPVSEFVRMFLLPEIDLRLKDGRLDSSQLPIRVSKFRAIFSKSRRVVEINDEVDLRGEMKRVTSRSIAAGDPIMLADIDPNEVYLLGPELDGERAGFYLAIAIYDSFDTAMDFTPGSPGEVASGKMRYPLLPIINAIELLKKIDPPTRYQELAKANWPPGLNFYPDILSRYQNGALAPDSPEFADAAAEAYGKEFWDIQRSFLAEIKAFPNHMPYLDTALERYFAADYISAISVVAPRLEGIIREYLLACGVAPASSQRRCLEQFGELIKSRQIILFPPDLIDIILTFIQQDFMKSTTRVADPAAEVNRHGVSHGVFTGFEDRDIALKYLVLLHALSFLILHDKLVTGTV